MWTAASVLACALGVLGRSQSSMPPIELIDIAPPDVSVSAEAFVRGSRGPIYVITSSVMFREAAAEGRDECSYSNAIRKLASVLAHEEWHVKHGPDEKAAYEHQLITLIRLGLDPGSEVYSSVQRSMLKVLDDRKRNHAARMLASR